MLLSYLLRRAVRVGQFIVLDADGRRHEFTGRTEGPTVTIRLHDRQLHTRLFFNPSLRLPEAFVDGILTVEDGDCSDLMSFIGQNIGWQGVDHWTQRVLGRCRQLGRFVAQYNRVPAARRNVAHHYDLSDRLYDLFLDRDRQYSCAYFGEPDDSLELAQNRKKLHLAAKLLLARGQKVLDIGSGWGGLGMHLAELAGVDVTGVTLSEEQYRFSNERARAGGVSDRVRFELQDYRNVSGSFDRIVSVGMFEHVGVPHYQAFFRKLASLLKDDGVAVLHTIGRADGPGATNAWIDKYIFPGGYSPALSEILPKIEQARLYVTDIEVLRLHYAETLRHWRERFQANRAEIARLYDERFCRMWEMYLCGCEAAFRHMGLVVFQIQLAKRQDAVPLIRDYITDFERTQRIATSHAA